MSQPKRLAADLKALQRRAGDVIDSDDSETLHRAAAELRRLSAIEAENEKLNRLLDAAAATNDQMTDWYKSAQLKAASAMAERDALAAELERVKGERVPLSDDEIKKLYALNHWHDMDHFTWGAASVVVRAIERAHGIKEDGNV